MNTAKSVAYGWAALVVAAGGSYYYAKKDLKGRKLDPAVRDARLRESPGNGTGTVTWQDRLQELEQRSEDSMARSKNASSTTLTSEPERPASRNHDQDVMMNSKPTGVDTSTSGPGARSER